MEPDAVIVVDEPLQIEAEPTATDVNGTVMVLVAVLVQPLAFRPVTVYVLEAVVLQVTVVAVVEFNPVAGLQVYDVPPAAVIVVELPLHIVAEPAVVVIVGKAFTVIVRVAVPVQPVALIPVTV